jgi:protein arginine N-methyltransferase 1
MGDKDQGGRLPEYSVSDYGSMITDRVRTQAYAKALERAVGPDSVVLDLGAGTGIFALLACRLDARQVFAIEPDDVIHVAQETARANGCADRIEFIQDISTRVTLPEQATILVSDLHGVLPLHRSALLSIADARDRLLTKSASLIPCSEQLWAAPIDAAELYAKRVERWNGTPYALDLEAARKLTVNEWSKAEIVPEMLLDEPALLATLDYRSLSDPHVQGDVTWTPERSGTLHGFAVWFDSELAPGISFSNAPGEPRLIYGQALFPLAEPTEVAAGNGISLRFSASLVGDDYVFAWATRVVDSGDGRVTAELMQSTLFALPLSAASLHRLAETAAPSLTPDGEAVSFVLSRVDGRRTLAHLSRETAERFPKLFRSADDALRFVTELTQKHAR